jgi:glycine cleavage system H protein
MEFKGIEIKEDRKFTQWWEWAKKENGLISVGITAFAASQAGDFNFFELPEEGQEVSQNEIVGSIETTKSVFDLHAPVSGEVVEVSEEVQDDPGIVNQKPFDTVLFKIKPSDENELGNLWTPEKELERVKEKLK